MQAIIASTSTLHGSSYLEYLQPTLHAFFESVDEVLFIPFARPGGISHQAYTKKAAEGLKPCFKTVVGLHEFSDMKKAISEANAIFVGGGNTFLLVKQLHDLGLMPILKQRIEEGAKYLGTSAGSNICGVSMQTTNDMPIVYPPSFKTLGILNFNINPHYLDADVTSKHKGETRETRIKEFQQLYPLPVLGLREGSWLQIQGSEVRLKGELTARLFELGKAPVEISSNSLLNI